jgi:hypothetical protein
MATVEECHAALESLAQRLALVDEEQRRTHALDRTISCHVTDLAVTFAGAIKDGEVSDITTAASPRAQVRLTMSSDDLIALTDGSLHLGTAWASGRVRIEASVFDLLKLGTFL